MFEDYEDGGMSTTSIEKLIRELERWEPKQNTRYYNYVKVWH